MNILRVPRRETGEWLSRSANIAYSFMPTALCDSPLAIPTHATVRTRSYGYGGFTSSLSLELTAELDEYGRPLEESWVGTLDQGRAAWYYDEEGFEYENESLNGDRFVTVSQKEIDVPAGADQQGVTGAFVTFAEFLQPQGYRRMRCVRAIGDHCITETTINDTTGIVVSTEEISILSGRTERLTTPNSNITYEYIGARAVRVVVESCSGVDECVALRNPHHPIIELRGEDLLGEISLDLRDRPLKVQLETGRRGVHVDFLNAVFAYD